MSLLKTLENVEIELGKIRREAYKAEDALILYLIDMTILAVKRKAVSQCKELRNSCREPARRVAELV